MATVSSKLSTSEMGEPRVHEGRCRDAPQILHSKASLWLRGRGQASPGEAGKGDTPLTSHTHFWGSALDWETACPRFYTGL